MTQIQFSEQFRVGLLVFDKLDEGHRLVFANDAARVLLDAPLRHGEPVADSSALGMFLASGKARDTMRVRREGQPSRWLEAERVIDQNTLHVAVRDNTEQRRLEALHRGIQAAQHRYFEDGSPESSIGGMLDQLIDLTESEYGFIGERMLDDEGQPYLKMHGFSTPVEGYAAFFEQHAPPSLEFRKLSNLFGHVITTGETVISNSPSTHPKSAGLPPGHPALRSFLGLPLQSGGQIAGMIGIANRPGGYDQPLVDWLSPYIKTCALLIGEMRNTREKRQIAQRLNEVISSTRDFFVTFDPAGTVLSANQAVMRAFEYTPEEVIGRNFIELVVPEDRDRALLGFGATLEGERIHDFDTLCVAKSGRKIWTRWNAKSEPGVKRTIELVGSDITRHRQDSEQLRLLALVAERTETSIIICGPDRKMVWVNPAFTKATGYTFEDALGRQPSELLANAPEDLEHFRVARETAQRGGTFTGEAMHRTKDGRTAWSYHEIRTIRSDTGELLNYVILSTDITDRKIAELRIREQQELLERTGQLARVGGWEADLATRAVRWSSEVYRIHEVDETFTPTRDSSIAFYAEESRGVFVEAVEAAKAKGTPFDLELQLHTALGNRIWARVTCEAEWRDGQVARLFGSIQDVTARKQAELRSLDQQAILERTGRTAKIGGWEVWYAPFRVTWTSEMYRIHEVDTSFVITRESSLSFYGEEAKQLLAVTLDAAKTRGEPFDIEVPLRTARGRDLRVRITAEAEIENGECVRIYGSMQDVTERWQSQREAREVSERLRLALQAAGMATWKWDLASETIHWDDDMYRLHGMDTSAPISVERFKTIVSSHDCRRFAAGLFNGKRKRSDISLRYDATVGKELRHFAGRALVQRDRSGTPVAVFGVCRDETNKRRSEIAAKAQLQALELARTALAAAKERAEQANRAKWDFLAVVSHEIRTPLNGILGMARLLAEGPLQSEEHEMVSTILSSAESLLGIINDILDFSKIEAGRLELASSEFHLAQLVEETADLLEPRAAEKGLVIGVSVCPSVPKIVRSDPGRIRQVILNLLGNAIKFTSAGHVTIGVDLPRPQAVRVVVRDTGMGIEPEQIGTLFERFTQADSSTSRRFGGTGLGLAIASELVQRLGGRLFASSEPGIGSAFGFTIAIAPAEADTPPDIPAACELRMQPGPARNVVENMLTLAKIGIAAGQGPVVFDESNYFLATGSADRRAIVLAGDRRSHFPDASVLTFPLKSRELMAALAGEPPPSRTAEFAARVDDQRFDGLRVLLVEDNEVNQRVARKMIESFGCGVGVAKHGLDAIQRLREQDFDLIFMDCQMPEMDGYETTRYVRRQPGLFNIPIIALTAAAFPEDLERCRDAGMDDHLSKPVSKESLHRAIVRWSRGAAAKNAPHLRQ